MSTASKKTCKGTGFSPSRYESRSPSVMFSAAARRSFVPRTSKARRTVGSVTDGGGLLIRRSAVNKQYPPSGRYSEHPQRVQRIVHEPLRQRARWLISRERPPRANELPSSVYLYFRASFHSTLLLMTDDARDFCPPRFSLTRFYVVARLICDFSRRSGRWTSKDRSMCAPAREIRFFRDNSLARGRRNRNKRSRLAGQACAASVMMSAAMRSGCSQFGQWPVSS